MADWSDCIELWGTGIYTYSRFYRVEENGTLKELKTSFCRGDSQPDLIADELTVYRKETKETLQEYYIVYDDLRVSPAEHLYATDAMSVLEDEIKVGDSGNHVMAVCGGEQR